MTGHVWGVQNSVMVPYSRLISLKKSTAASHKEREPRTTASLKDSRTVHGEPLVDILALGQHHGASHVAAAQRGLGVLGQLVAFAIARVTFHGLECLVFVRAAQTGFVRQQRDARATSSRRWDGESAVTDASTSNETQPGHANHAGRTLASLTIDS